MTDSQGTFREPDLARMLEAMGPNELTELADGLMVDGLGPRRAEDSVEWKDMGTFRESLTEFLEPLNHAFIGGLAVRTYLGVRPTMDFDIMIDQAGLTAMHKFLETQGGALRDSVEDTYHYVVVPIQLDVDVRIARSGLDREALKAAVDAAYRTRRLRIVRADHLAAMKVKAYSERKDQPEGRQDADDVRNLIARGRTSAFSVRDVLARHRPDLLVPLDEILAAAR